MKEKEKIKNKIKNLKQKNGRVTTIAEPITAVPIIV